MRDSGSDWGYHCIGFMSGVWLYSSLLARGGVKRVILRLFIQRQAEHDTHAICLPTHLWHLISDDAIAKELLLYLVAFSPTHGDKHNDKHLHDIMLSNTRTVINTAFMKLLMSNCYWDSDRHVLIQLHLLWFEGIVCYVILQQHSLCPYLYISRWRGKLHMFCIFQHNIITTKHSWIKTSGTNKTWAL